jgi:predicted porin
MFQLDLEHNTATGAADSTTSSTGGAGEGADLAVSTVGLSGAFGQVTLGKMAFRGRDGGGLYRFFGNIGRLAAESTGTAMNTGDELQGAIEYVSPSIQGFTVSYGLADNGRTAAGALSARQDSITIRGAFGPVNFQYGQETAKAAQAANAAASIERKVNTFAANANLNVARVGLVYAENKSAEASPTTTRAMGVHTAVPMGAITLGANYTNYKVASGDGKSDVFALVAQYDFSKRTKVYGTYQSITAGATAAGITATRGLKVSEVAGQTRTGYAISVVHSF